MKSIEDETGTTINHLRHLFAYTLAQKFIKDKTVLDIGCSGGYGAHYLIKNGAKCVIGVDISKSRIDHAIKKYTHQKLQFKVMNGTKLEFEDNTFDVVTSFQVIEHISDYMIYLSEIYRVLKPSGVFLVSTPNGGLGQPICPDHVKEFSSEEFLHILNTFFSNVELFGIFDSDKVDIIEKSLKQKFRVFVGQLLTPNLRVFIKNIIPKSIREIIYRDIKTVSLDDFHISNTNIEKCVDLFAICAK